MKEIPVFLFTGFLGAGKTTFIQDTLGSSDFDDGERTLLLLCEEGEVELEPDKFVNKDVFIEVIENEEDLYEANLIKLANKHPVDRVMIEYNGMWMLQSLFEAMPRNWVIAQEMLMIDASTFLLYNQNMRQQTFNKLQTAELVVFNRCEKGFDKMPFHKEVRIANRRSQILYEYGPQDVEVDDIPDPLPYDKSKKEITIEDDWYAEWYRDINENDSDYEGKVITIKGRVALAEELPDGKFAFGRHVMTCCVEDIQFAGLMAIYARADEFNTGDWVEIKAKVRVEYEDAYREKGPVLYCKSVTPCEPTDPEVATF
jgi:putative membrane protein